MRERREGEREQWRQKGREIREAGRKEVSRKSKQKGKQVKREINREGCGKEGEGRGGEDIKGDIRRPAALPQRGSQWAASHKAMAKLAGRTLTLTPHTHTSHLTPPPDQQWEQQLI